MVKIDIFVSQKVNFVHINWAKYIFSNNAMRIYLKRRQVNKKGNANDNVRSAC